MERRQEEAEETGVKETKERSKLPVVRELCGEAEADAAARVCKRAFNHVQVPQFGYMVSFNDEEVSCRVHRAFSSWCYSVVACHPETGAIIGSNYLDQRGQVASIGPISVDPDVDASGVGRALMNAAIEKATKDGHKSIRLQQEAFNLASFSLYAKLGFEPKEQISNLIGRCEADWPEPRLKLTIRPMTMDDLPACAALHKRVVGVDRSVELKASLSPSWVAVPLVAVEDDADGGHIVGYKTSATGLGHGVATCDEVMARLHYELTQRVPPERLKRKDDVVLQVMGRLSPALLQWGLNRAGLRLQRLSTLMALGDYAEPSGGAYSPSVMY